MGGSRAASPAHPATTIHEEGELQAKLDQLNDEQLDRVIEFLQLHSSGDSGEEFQLDLDALLPAERVALNKLVEDALRKTSSTAAAMLGHLSSADTTAGIP